MKRLFWQASGLDFLHKRHIKQWKSSGDFLEITIRAASLPLKYSPL